MSTHSKDCELGENHKDCPACNPEHEHSKGESVPLVAKTPPGKHAPETLSDRIVQCWFAGIPCPDLRALADNAPETAAERDRLRDALLAEREIRQRTEEHDIRLRKILREITDRATASADQAREQVNTLLAACKLMHKATLAPSGSKSESDLGRESYLAYRAAIKSVDTATLKLRSAGSEQVI